REATAAITQRLAETDVAHAKLYPTFSATGSYTLNQYEVSTVDLIPGSANAAAASPGTVPMDPVIIQPRHQLDGNLTIQVPIVDFGIWRRLSAAEASSDATRAQQRATELEVDNQVYRAYYQLLGQEAVLGASRRTLDLLRKNLEQVRVKIEGGTASLLDEQRARAEIARAEGDVAASEFAVVTARRTLSTATYVEPEPATGFVDDDLHEEKAIDIWLSYAGSTPRVDAANAAQHATEKSVAAAEAGWYPTLNAQAQERFTNASAFTGGREAVFLLQASLAWKFDFSLPANVRAQEAAAAVAHVRTERAQRATEDSIFTAWHQVRTSIEKARAARVQIEASQTAADLARDRYAAGAATQLDVLQAEQDAFRAQVARIQADTELVYARASLRASAGKLSDLPGERTAP
ncbi:MAG: hypothetical protein RL701_5725, partial [Pseudomonadota bacterium]